jgi:predicted lipid-binding transport protein (Tim44 family)
MKWLLGLCVLALGVVLALPEAEARRFGGGRSIGIQRNVQKAPPAATPAKPAQQQTAPAASGSKWGPILGGLALGGLLAYLFSGNGLAGLLLIALLAFAAVMAFRLLAQRRAPAPQRMQYAGFGNETIVAPPPSQALGGRLQAPAGFDSEAFLRGAKTNFIKLQMANDAGAMEEIRDFTTDEMFAELGRERGQAGQQTDVVSLDAQLLEVATEGDKYWASVRFSGLVREAAGSEAAAFSEVWHLAKPVDGSSGWLLAGIQQMH